MKLGLVLEGGSFRGIFTAGVLDVFMESGITFPYVTGVSAGAGNALNYIAGQQGRTHRVILHENADPYYGIGQMRKSGKLLDLDKMVYDYSYSQIPFDFKAFFASNTECELVVANCQKGEAEYLSPEGSEERLLQIAKATCSIPLMCNPVTVGDYDYMDGSTIDSVPFAHALERCDRVVVILTRPEGEVPTDYSKMRALLNICYGHKYPALVDRLVNRFDVYADQMKDLEKRVAEGKAFVIRPTVPSIRHFEKEAERIDYYYNHGRDQAEQYLAAMKAFME